MKLLAVLALLYLAVMLLAALTAPGTTPGDRRGSVSFGSSPVPATAEAVPEAAGRAVVRRPAATRSRPLGPRLHWHALDVTCYVATGRRTASGAWPREGMAASNLYAFGTRLDVKGAGVVVVTDRIGHGADVDLFYRSLSRCRRFGRQHLSVAVLP